MIPLEGDRTFEPFSAYRCTIEKDNLVIKPDDRELSWKFFDGEQREAEIVLFARTGPVGDPLKWEIGVGYEDNPPRPATLTELIHFAQVATTHRPDASLTVQLTKMSHAALIEAGDMEAKRHEKFVKMLEDMITAG